MSPAPFSPTVWMETEMIEFSQHIKGANMQEKKQYCEWRVPESWINAAVNMYLNTIEDTPGERRCNTIDIVRNANGDKLFVVATQKTTFQEIIAT